MSFYRNIESIELSQGTTLRVSGKVLKAEQILPNMDFLTMPCKESQRIQHKHYKEFIKNGNLKRLLKEQTVNITEHTEKEFVEDDLFKEIPLNEPNQKVPRRSINESSIIVKNADLFRELKNIRNNDINRITKRFPESLQKTNTKENNFVESAVDRFNLIALAHPNRSAREAAQCNLAQLTDQNEKGGKAPITRQTDVVRKLRVRKATPTHLRVS